MSAHDVAIIVVAAGTSSRFGADKLASPLGGRSVLARAVEAVRTPFPSAPAVVVVREGSLAAARERWEGASLRVVAGGARRQDSVRNGFEALDPGDDTVVVIHDGARPFVPAADVEAVVGAALEEGAALLVAPVVDTIKRLDGEGRVLETVRREPLARALTPQAFLAGTLRRAWAARLGSEWSDEAGLIEAAGGMVKAVPGDPRNLKVTRPGDLALLSGLFGAGTRVGQGIDVHPFARGRRLWLCGVEIPGEEGLAGHSDADVALHAVTDAILGACGAGDIGQHFPPSEERWRGEPSSTFVHNALALAQERGFRLVNCDVTVLADRPRVAPFRERMTRRLAELLGLPVDRVNLKATTCEGLGFVGRNEGIVAMAVATLEQPAFP